MKRTVAMVVAAGAAVFAGGCGGSAPTTPAPGITSVAPSPSEAASLKTASTPLGTYLVDGSGRTLYLFEADTGKSSTCYGACAGAWPPYTTTGTPTGGGGRVNPALIGITTRTDHTTQLTYNGHPLYYFAEDTQTGQTKGQGVDAFGARWYVVSPAGTAITAAAAPSPSATGGVKY
jgi:predicted lipoprotein with Yx(FWY)xxD motif